MGDIMVQEGHCVASQVTLEFTLHIAFLPRKSDQNQSKELAFYNMVIGCVCERKRQRDRERRRDRERQRESTVGLGKENSSLWQQ